jgi:Mn-dependent DtxR family transcriptional regulator
MEEIYQTKPHVRIIYVLHGDREEMNRKDIAAATGIGGAIVLNALYELDKAKIIKYDENTGMAKLVKRILPKVDKSEGKK